MSISHEKKDGFIKRNLKLTIVIASLLAAIPIITLASLAGNDNLELISLAVTLILTVLALDITIIQVLDYRQEKRTEEFRMLNLGLSKFRFNYAEKLRKEYDEANTGKGFAGTDHPLIGLEGWFPDNLVTLGSAVKLHVPDEKRDGDYNKVGNLYTEKDADAIKPRRDLPFSYNSRIYLNKNIFNNRIFIVENIEKNWRVGIDFTVVRSTYDKFYDTCELIAHLSAYRLDMKPKAKRTIDLLDYHDRAIGIGVCTLTVIRFPQEQIFFLVHHRSDKVGEAPGTVSMVPAGSFAPTGEYDEPNSDNAPNGVPPSLADNVFREFEEELLGLPEVEHPLFYKPICDYREHAILKKAFNEDRLYYLGMGFDPVTTKMEMVTMLVIDWTADLEEAFFKLCESRTADLTEIRKIKDDATRVEAFFNEVSSSEGERVDLLPFDETTIDRMYGDRQCMPVFRESMYQCSSHRLQLYRVLKGLPWSP